MQTQHGTPATAEALRALWAPEGACSPRSAPVLRDGRVTCPACGAAFIRIGSSSFHPDTTALRRARGEQEPDTALGNYYVTIKDGGKTGILAGPFVNDHPAALAMVDAARRVANEVAPDQTAFASFGTARFPSDYTTPGRLNEQLGLGVA